MTGTDRTCLGCGAVARAFMCRSWASDAAKNARRVPELLAELTTTISRSSWQSAAGHRLKGGGPTDAREMNPATLAQLGR